MKKLLFLSVLFLLGCTLIQGQITAKPHNIAVQPYVTILHTEPDQPVEGMPLIIYFRLTNNNLNGSTLNGWIGADINSGTGYPGISSGDWQVINLPNKEYIDGAVWLKTPDAGINRLIRVYFYQTQQPSGTGVTKSPPLYEIGQQTINIGALLNYKLENFKINHTRARSTDTDWASLFVSQDGQPVMQSTALYLGDFQDGTYPFKGKDAEGNQQNSMETGPFTIVPGNNSTLRISYFIYNGGSIEDRKGFLNGFASATADPSLFHGKRPGKSTLFTAMRVLNPFFLIMGACDGFVVGDTMVIQSNDLYSNTFMGNVDFSRRFNTEAYASQAGCGNTSDYEVFSNMKKISTPTNPRYGYKPGWSVHDGGKLEFDPRLKMTLTSWQRLETIGPSGEFITVTEPAYGYISGLTYHAPAQISKPMLVIIRGNRSQFQVEGNDLNVLADGPLGKVTQIVQLLPGPQIMNPNIYNDYTPPKPETEKKVNPPPAQQEGAKPVIEKKVTPPPVQQEGAKPMKPRVKTTKNNF